MSQKPAASAGYDVGRFARSPGPEDLANHPPCRPDHAALWSPWLADVLTPLLAGAAALVLYGLTLAPGLTWAHDGADGGDLLAAALTRGVPHPPGYPLHQLLLRLTIALAPGISPARAGNWLSAVCAAAAAALLVDLARRSLRSGPSLPGGIARSAGRVPALIAALAWAASPALWGQAVITEVYTLHALCVVSVMWLLWRWREAACDGRLTAPLAPGASSSAERAAASRSVRETEAAHLSRREKGVHWLVLACLVFGLGLANHLSIALLAPGALSWIWANRAGLARAPRWTGPAAAAGLAAGIGLYLYLPWAAAAHPPVNWGDPAGLPGLAWLVTAQAYRALLFGLAPADLPGRLAAWAGQAAAQFWPWGAVLALFGLWRLDRIDHAWWRFTGLNALCFSIYALAYNTTDSYVYLIPAWAMAALWLAQGIGEIAACRNPVLPKDLVSGVGLALCVLLLPVASAAVRWPAMDLSRDAAAEQYIDGALGVAQPGGVIVAAGDERTFALWYAVYGLGRRPDLTPLNANLYAYPWYRATLARRHPALSALGGSSDPPDLPDLLLRLAAAGPLYRAEALPVGASVFQERPAGPLVQLLPRR